jgi:hypothetical protein
MFGPTHFGAEMARNGGNRWYLPVSNGQVHISKSSP